MLPYRHFYLTRLYRMVEGQQHLVIKLCRKKKALETRAVPLLAIAQGTAAIGGMLIKGINALVDAKRANAIKCYKNVKCKC